MKTCVVIGAGVVGLTTAVVLQKQGWKVTIVARATPRQFDWNDETYASPKAGAHWCPNLFDSDSKHREYEAETFKVLCSLVAKHPFIMFAPSKLFLAQKPQEWRMPWFADLVKDFKLVDAVELPPQHLFGFQYTTTCINVPQYLEWLVTEFERQGGQFEIRTVQHINELFGRWNVVINCSGLGSKTLGGVEDDSMYPIRGQIAVIPYKADFAALSERTEMEETQYIIPRPDGTTIIGGTFAKHRSDMIPLDDIYGRFKDRCANIHWQVGEWQNQTSDDGVKHVVGLRPARKDGIRVDAQTKVFQGRNVVLVNNYGHSAYGYQTSWGTSLEASRVLNRALFEQDFSQAKL